MSWRIKSLRERYCDADGNYIEEKYLKYCEFYDTITHPTILTIIGIAIFCGFIIPLYLLFGDWGGFVGSIGAILTAITVYYRIFDGFYSK